MIIKWLRRVFRRKTRSDYYELRSEDIEVLKITWERAKKKNIGQHILRVLIERRPVFMDYYGIKVASQEELDSCKEFQLQACRIQNFFDTTIGTLGFCPITSVHQMAHRIGQIHYYKGVNFGADNWLTFKCAAVDIITGQIKKDATNGDLNDHNSVFDIGGLASTSVTKVAWEKFMGIIIREMKRGFLEEALKNCEEEMPSR